MDSLTLLITVLALGLLIYGPWQRQCEDWGRQQLFEIRDSIFNLAADGRIGFDDPRYRTIRDSINTLIRFMHECTWPRLIYLTLFFRWGRHLGLNRTLLEKAVNDIDEPELKRIINEKIYRMGYVVLVVVIWRSPFLLAVAVLVNFLLRILSFVEAIASFASAAKGRIYLTSFSIAHRDAECFEGSLSRVAA